MEPMWFTEIEVELGNHFDRGIWGIEVVVILAPPPFDHFPPPWGDFVGCLVGGAVGDNVGCSLGECVGCFDGLAVGGRTQVWPLEVQSGWHW